MSVVLLFGGIVVVVCGLTFIAGRRFGPLALALAAGSLLANLWSENTAIIIGGMGVSIPGLPSSVIATLVLTMLPLFLLLAGGPRYGRLLPRVLAAVLIALLSAALLVQPLGRHMSLEGDALAVYRLLSGWWQHIVTIGLVAGLLDVFVLHAVPAKVTRAGKKH